MRMIKYRTSHMLGGDHTGSSAALVAAVICGHALVPSGGTGRKDLAHIPCAGHLQTVFAYLLNPVYNRVQAIGYESDEGYHSG